jgi:16S rRNA (cytosine967-C5)-methyltransferase
MKDESQRVRSQTARGARGQQGSASHASPARLAAFEALTRVYEDRAYSSALLASPAIRDLSPADRALANELTLGVLRWQASLDYLIERYSGRSVARLDLPVLMALRIGIYQLRFLDRIPASAAVDESVKLVKSSRAKSAAGLVNAVLRRASANQDDQPGFDLPDASERLATEVSHPRWLMERWEKHFASLARARSIALSNNTPARISFRVNRLRATEELIINELQSVGISLRKSSISASGLVVEGGPVSAVIEAADKGLIHIQDEASQLVGELLDARPGELILDMCAAPGSKTTHIADLCEDRATIIACDLRLHRLRTLRVNCDRMRIGSVLPLLCDGTMSLPFRLEVAFDRILVDAPCSGTGTLRQNPEIKWRLIADDFARLAGIQTMLIEQAARAVKTGGLLVYSTCSIEPEENEQVIERFLAEHSDFVKEVPGAAEVQTVDGFARLFPDTHGTEGFFIAALRKRL